MNIHAQPLRLNDPISELRECHRKIEHFLQVLHNVVTEAPSNGLPPPHSVNLENVLNFFSTAGQRHTADEEEFLFPRLRMDPLAALIIEGLEGDHKRAESLHQTIETLGREWLNLGSITRAERRKLRETTDELIRLSLEHIKIEDQRLFPLAIGRLDPRILRKVGEDMTFRRRGL